MLAYDVFRNDNWTALEVTEAAGDLVYIPGTLARMNIFDVEPIATLEVGVYKDSETLALVPITERGAPETLPERDISTLTKLPTVALRQRDRINASEVQSLFAIPGLTLERGLERAWNEVEKRQRKLMRKLEITREHHRLAAIQGILLDADGSQVMSFYEKFGYVAPAAVSFNFGTLTAGALREYISVNIIMPMLLALGEARRTPNTRIVALVGDSFFHKLLKNEEYRSTYLGIPQQVELRQDPTWGTIEAFGVTWMHYRGASNGMLAIGTNDALFFPAGAVDVFKEYRSPGEDWAQVNGEDGREFYSVVSPDYRPNMMEWVDVYLRSYPLICCVAPNVLRKGTAV